MTLDYETNMALLSYLSGLQLKKQIVPECDFADIASFPGSSAWVEKKEPSTTACTCFLGIWNFFDLKTAHMHLKGEYNHAVWSFSR